MSDVLHYARAQITAHRLISFLLSLILAIGVATCVLVTGLVRAGGEEVQRLSFGPLARSLVIRDNVFVPHPYGEPSLAELDALQQRLGARIETASAWRSARVPVTSERREILLQVHGITGPVATQLQLDLAWGQMPTPAQNDRLERVCVAGATAYRRLAPGREPGPMPISVNAIRCELVGVLASGDTRVSAQYDNAIFMPFRTATTYVFDSQVAGPEDADQLLIVLATSDDLDAARMEADQIIRARRGVSQARPSPVTFNDPNTSVDVAVRQRDLLNSGLVFLGAATLFASMIGYSAASYALTRTRRSDFAIQLACGASPATLFLQGACESAIIGLAGGILGVAIASALSGSVVGFTGLEAAVTFADYVWPLGLGIAVGILAGSLGAFSSAQTDPEDSLRAP